MANLNPLLSFLWFVGYGTLAMAQVKSTTSGATATPTPTPIPTPTTRPATSNNVLPQTTVTSATVKPTTPSAQPALTSPTTNVPATTIANQQTTTPTPSPTIQAQHTVSSSTILSASSVASQVTGLNPGGASQVTGLNPSVVTTRHQTDVTSNAAAKKEDETATTGSPAVTSESVPKNLHHTASSLAPSQLTSTAKAQTPDTLKTPEPTANLASTPSTSVSSQPSSTTQTLDGKPPTTNLHLPSSTSPIISSSVSTMVSSSKAVISTTSLSISASTQNPLLTVMSPRTSNPTVTPQSSIKVICQKTGFDDSQVKLTMKHTRDCNSDVLWGPSGKQDDKGVADLLCRAVKSGFQPGTDTCSIVLGHEEQPTSQLAILEVKVQSRSVPKDLYTVLENNKDKIKEHGFSNVSYNASKLSEQDEDWLSMPLIITIVCLAVSLLIIAAIYGCWHQRRSHKRDQRLTEELQTMENGYHDNPTLEVMETSPEMQEKKGGLNGELGDSWIVPLDHLIREDMEEEEDTHL
ncbi:podocalyxin isoform X1 [Ascaphus truei]|uniref:podocalyxin isoform X1 n=1 Tax=Ascaphus truei TaxID=8439 RepID=UPI003F5ACF18